MELQQWETIAKQKVGSVPDRIVHCLDVALPGNISAHFTIICTSKKKASWGTSIRCSNQVEPPCLGGIRHSSSHHEEKAGHKVHALTVAHLKWLRSLLLLSHCKAPPMSGI